MQYNKELYYILAHVSKALVSWLMQWKESFSEMEKDFTMKKVIFLYAFIQWSYQEISK